MNSMLLRSPSGDCAQFHRHAPQCTHFSRSNTGSAFLAQRDRLARAHRDARLLLAGDAAPPVEKHHVIGESRHGLHLAAHQQRILVRHQQLAVEGNLRPAARRHQRIVQRAPVVERERDRLLQLKTARQRSYRTGESASAPAECAPSAKAARQ